MSNYLFPTPGKVLRKLLDIASAVGEKFDDDMATTDMMLSIDRDDIKPQRYLVKRWGWSRHQVRAKTPELIKKSEDWRSFNSPKFHPKPPKGHPNVIEISSKKPISAQRRPDSAQYSTDTDINNSKELSSIDLQNSWNEFAKKADLSPIRSLSKNRLSWIRARRKKIAPLLPEIYEQILKSDFLMGRKKSWRVSFDFIWKNDHNYLKILEGEYANSELATDEPNNNPWLSYAQMLQDAMSRGIQGKEAIRKVYVSNGKYGNNEKWRYAA